MDDWVVKKLSVGVDGFEPSASWSQTKHSSRTELHPEIGL